VNPFLYEELARIIHQERIQAAQARRPEWMYAPPSSARAWQESSATRLLRRMVAQSLCRVAARLGRTSLAGEASSSQTASAQ